MPSYIRLLSFFSNFILRASFLGIGVGCLLATSKRRLFHNFPALLVLVIGAVFAGRLESLFYAVLIFSPIACAGLLFGSAIKHSQAVARDYGFNLLLVVIALAYVGAILARRSSEPQLVNTGQ